MFYNFTNSDFTGKWDGKLYTFKPFQRADGDKIIIADDQQHSVLLTEAVAKQFGHQLAINILNNPKLDTNFLYNDKGEQIPQDIVQMAVYNNTSIDALISRAMSEPEAVVDMPAKLAAFVEEAQTVPPEIVEEPAEETVATESSEAPKRRGRPKKESSPSENVEFAISVE